MGTYNPILDLVVGSVLILVPLVILVGLGVGLLIGAKETAGKQDSSKSRKRDEEIVRSLEILHQNQDRLLSELRDLSEENRQRLQALLAETDRLKALLTSDLAETADLADHPTWEPNRN